MKGEKEGRSGDGTAVREGVEEDFGGRVRCGGVCCWR